MSPVSKVCWNLTCNDFVHHPLCSSYLCFSYRTLISLLPSCRILFFCMLFLIPLLIYSFISFVLLLYSSFISFHNSYLFILSFSPQFIFCPFRTLSSLKPCLTHLYRDTTIRKLVRATLYVIPTFFARPESIQIDLKSMKLRFM